MASTHTEPQAPPSDVVDGRAGDLPLMMAARFGLPRQHIPASDPLFVEHQVFEGVCSSARADRLTGLLAAAVDASVLELADRDVTSIDADRREMLTGSVVLECQAAELADLFATAKVRWCLTKGPALAHLDYPNPGWRGFGDIDIVVHRSSWEQALTVMQDAGYTRQHPELAPGFDQRFGKGATFLNPLGFEIDVHRRFAIGRFGLLGDPTELFERATAISLAGREVPVFDPLGRMIHACFHASLGGFRRNRAFRDVAQLMLCTGVPVDQVIEFADRQRVQPVVASAVIESWQRLGLVGSHELLDWARRQQCSRREQRALDTFAEERPFREQALTALPVLSWRLKPMYLWALARSGRSNGRPLRRRVQSWGASLRSALDRRSHATPSPQAETSGERS